MPSTLLDARRITRHHGARTLLDSVDVRIDAGSRIALIGPNGAGKSTLLRILAGLERPDAGTVHAHGSVGYLPQLATEATGAGGDATVRATILERIGVAPAARRLDALAAVGIAVPLVMLPGSKPPSTAPARAAAPKVIVKREIVRREVVVRRVSHVVRVPVPVAATSAARPAATTAAPPATPVVRRTSSAAPTRTATTTPAKTTARSGTAADTKSDLPAATPSTTTTAPAATSSTAQPSTSAGPAAAASPSVASTPR